MNRLPSKTTELLEMLEDSYPDRYEIRDLSPFEYGKRAGVIELLRKLQSLQQQGDL